MESVLKGEKVYLRPITAADTDRILKWRNCKRVMDNFIYRVPLTRDVHEQWLRNKVATGDVVQMIICEQGALPESPVGSVYLRDVDRENGTAEYGIFLGEDAALGKGYAKDAARLMVRYAFEVLGLQSLGLRVFEDNLAARRSYEYAGFRTVERMPGVTCTDGTVRDMVWMEIRR